MPFSTGAVLSREIVALQALYALPTGHRYWWGAGAGGGACVGPARRGAGRSQDEPGSWQTQAVRRPFCEVDVFCSEPFAGNPVAVVLDADGLTGAEMQRFARWTN